MTTGLLVIDLQRGMFSEVEKPHQGELVLERTAGLLRRARADGVPIFHVQHDGGPGDPLAKSGPGFEIHPAVKPADGEPVIEKSVCSAYQNTDLDERLRAQGIDRVVIAGMQTEYCIDTTCRAAFGLGYRVALVSDAHTTFNSPVLTAPQVIAHHNHTLRSGFVELVEAANVKF
jgi:nicotinamidase-related amidase